MPAGRRHYTPHDVATYSHIGKASPSVCPPHHLAPQSIGRNDQFSQLNMLYHSIAKWAHEYTITKRAVQPHLNISITILAIIPRIWKSHISKSVNPQLATTVLKPSICHICQVSIDMQMEGSISIFLLHIQLNADGSVEKKERTSRILSTMQDGDICYRLL